MNDQELQKIVDDIIVEHDKHYEIKGVASLALKINNALKEVRAAQKKEDESLVWLSRFRKAEEKLKTAREALKKAKRHLNVLETELAYYEIRDFI